MRLGRLPHSITIQTRATTQDTAGEPLHTWTTLYQDIPARVEPISGRELLAGGGVQEETTHRVGVYWREGITGAVRVLFNARVFDVLRVINVGERDRELELLCSEGLTRG